MPRVSGPTIPRWHLAKHLERLRQEAGLGFEDVADRLNCSPSKIKKIERADVGVDLPDLEVMLQLYGVTDRNLQDMLLDLQRKGKKRGWWVPLGPFTRHYATLVSLESESLRIRMFEPLVIPGLLQTEDYARAIDAMHTLATPRDREHMVEVRMARQQRFWKNEADPTRLWVILDEAALRRQVGGPLVMRAQLMHLLERMSQCTFQIVPFEAGGYPGSLGALTIFDFEEHIHSPVAYVDGHAGIIYVENADEMDRINLAFGHITAVALSPAESARRVMAIVREMAVVEEEGEGGRDAARPESVALAEVKRIDGLAELR